MSASVLALSPQMKYGGAMLSGTSSTDDSQLPAVSGPAPADQTPVYHPGHPLFWLAAILAGAVGLAYFSTTVRVGPVEASGSIGKK